MAMTTVTAGSEDLCGGHSGQMWTWGWQISLRPASGCCRGVDCGLCCKHPDFLSTAMAGAGAGEETAHA